MPRTVSEPSLPWTPSALPFPLTANTAIPQRGSAAVVSRLMRKIERRPSTVFVEEPTVAQRDRAHARLIRGDAKVLLRRRSLLLLRAARDASCRHPRALTTIGIADATRQRDDAVERQYVAVERIEGGVVGVRHEHALAQIVEDDDLHGAAEAAEALLVQFAPAAGVRRKGQQADALAAVAE